MSKNDQRTLRRILRGDFASFIAKCFATVNPGEDFLPNWHIDCIAEYLEAARAGELTRLIINLPPRALKSLSVTVAWPAFILGHGSGGRASSRRATRLRLPCVIRSIRGW